MNRKYSFYYDESEHSRRINQSTVTAKNYYDNFVTVIVGWDVTKEQAILDKYEEFENKYLCRQSKGELKSKTIKNRYVENGFASLNKSNTEFVKDFLSFFDDDIFLYFAVTSKIEYIVSQLFAGYSNTLFLNVDYMKYSIVKAILLYQPKKIIDGIYENTAQVVELLQEFFIERIEANKQNPDLKKHESIAFTEILTLLNNINEDISLDWNYHMSFDGFKKYLNENQIVNYSLSLDKEGNDSRTLVAAHEVGLKELEELDSKDSPGIRIADMLAGITSKILKALHSNMKYKEVDDVLSKKLLPAEWFDLNDDQLALYKSLKYVIIEMNKAWYKGYSGNYSDDLITFIALINYMSHFTTVKEMKNKSFKEHQEYFNSNVIEDLQSYYKRLGFNFPIDFVIDDGKDYVINRQGAKVYLDASKHSYLSIEEGNNIYNVLSVGFTRDGISVITVSEVGKSYCYRLPAEYNDWVLQYVGLANLGFSFFPTYVNFTKDDSNYYADFC